MSFEDRTGIKVHLPKDVRCAVALSYDLEMCGGYQLDGVCHGRIIPEVQEYTLKLCDTAEKYGVRLQFFHVGNGLEEENIDYLKEILKRGHVIDSHTYSHISLLTENLQLLDEELAKTNRLLKEKLGWKSAVLRGPGGYQDGLINHPAQQEIILKNGFQWVSCKCDATLSSKGYRYAVEASSRDTPFAYPSGLIEIPFQGFTDRQYFEGYKNISPSAYNQWRTLRGGGAVPKGWQAPWTAPDALETWIAYNLEALDFAHEHRALWVPVWHPRSHYLHDPQNCMLPSLLEHCASKPEKVWVCTVREAAAMLQRQ